MTILGIRNKLKEINERKETSCVKMLFTHGAFKAYEKAVWEVTGLIVPIPFEIDHIPCTVIGDVEHHSRNLKNGDVIFITEEVWPSH